jgi:hypothetical protein
MPVATDTLAEDIKGLTASMHAMREDFAGWKGSVETELNLIRTLGKWILAAFTSIAIVALTGGGGLIWSAATLSSEVKHQGVRIDKLEAKVDRLEQKVDQGFGQINQQLGLISQRLDQVGAKTKGGP